MKVKAKTVLAKTLYHGLNRGSVAGDLKVPLFLAYDIELAGLYSDTGEVLEFEDLSTNPLILDTPEKFIEAWKESEADSGTSEKFHPNMTHRFAGWAKSKGHDAIYIPESAFEGDLGFEWVTGTFGDPQVIILDKNSVKLIGKQHHESEEEYWG